MSPSEGRRAPDRIQQIVKAVLERNAMRGIQLTPPTEHNRAVEMTDGRLTVATVRQFCSTPGRTWRQRNRTQSVDSSPTTSTK